MILLEDYLPLWMFISLIICLLSGFPVAFVLAGVALLSATVGWSLDLFSWVELNNIVFRVWGSIAENLLLVAIPMYIFMGVLLEKSQIAEELLMALQQLLHRFKGGLAISVVLIGILLAASTGIIGASVVTLGIIALPVMLQQQYKKELAVGTICSAGTLGILIPPSIMLILMGELLSVSVADLFMAAIIPGMILAILYLIYIIFITQFKPDYAPQTLLKSEKASKQLFFQLIMRVIPPILLIFMVLGSIFFGLATPTEASGIGAFGALLLALLKRRLNLTVLRQTLQQSSTLSAMIFAILIGATAFSYVFRSLGGDDLVEELMLGLALGAWGTLIVVMLFIFILGFFFDWIEITLIVLPIFGPLIANLDFGEVFHSSQDVLLWFAILTAINLQTSFLTPPLGFALFYLKGVAPDTISSGHIYRGILPFVMLQLIGLVLVLLIPQLVLWLPSITQ